LILAFVRTQSKGKMRAVFGYPLEAIMVEGQYAIPLIDRIKKLNAFNGTFIIPYGVKSASIW